MIDREIQAKMRDLRGIQPDEHFSASSKTLLMSHKTGNFELNLDKNILTKLAALKTIQPDANYALQTKLSVLEADKLSRNRFIELFTFKNFVNSSLALGLTAVLMAILATGGYKYLSPASSLSVADDDALIAEAETISKDIDIHLREAEYFASAARKTNLALNEASINSYGHLNDRVIEREAVNINIESPVNRNIDDLLNEATF